MEFQNLRELMNKIDYKDHAIYAGLGINGIQYDSRKVQAGNLFVAIKGLQSDGHQYIAQALEKGAIAILVCDEEYCSWDYPWILVEDSRLALAQISAAFYDYPSDKLKLIGVTGTNGKTTTTNLIAQILESKGHKTGLIGTIHNRIGDKILAGSRTTPESLELQALFAEMVKEKVEYAIMEVSSHALDLHRVSGCNFDVAVFTNLTQDHLDYHQTMEAYCKAKTKLFTMLRSGKNKGIKKTGIINLDDMWAKEFLLAVEGDFVTYGVEKDAMWKAENITVSANATEYMLQGKKVALHLTGTFNVYNSLAALTAAMALGISLEDGIAALGEAKGVAGRFQRVLCDKPYAVIVDYAHTPDGLINVLKTAREIVQNRLITVFGCGGDRDRTKRPLMGTVAAKLSDYCIVTSDNPRTEDPQSIIEDILPGVRAFADESKYMVEADRRKAIFAAIAMAKPGDLIMLAGKGHEDYQEINGQKHHFDDYEVALEAMGAESCAK